MSHRSDVIPGRGLIAMALCVLGVLVVAGVHAAPPAGGPARVAATQAEAAGEITEFHTGKDADLNSVLRVLTETAQINVVMSAKVDAGQKVTADLYDVSLDEALDSLLTPLGLVYQRKGKFIYIYTRKEMEDAAKQQRLVSSAVLRLRYITAADAAAIIKPLLSQQGMVSTTAAAAAGVDAGGSGDGSGSTGGNSYSTDDAIVVTDFPDNLRQIAGVIRDLDVRPRQVLVEATILRATLTETNALGVDFNLLSGVDFNMQVSQSSGGDSGDSGGSSETTAGIPGNAASIDHAMDKATSDNGVMSVRTDFLDPSIFPRGGFSFGIIKNNIAAFVRALEEVTDTTVVANPKVLALNKQRGEVIVGRRDGYLTTIQTETESVQKVEFLETGVQLRFRPYIADDGYVRMELHPEDSSGGLTSANLPFEETTEVTTNVLVKDGHTIVIGGLFREHTSANRAQVPWLGNIPYAGVLFRRRSDNTVREEVIILLTVHIVENNQAYAKAGERALEDVERLRVGMRQSLMPWGRERLAQAHYKWALEHLENGNTHKALWDLNMATHLNPRFLDAIKKKEELTNQRAWEANTSLVHNFIYNRVLGAEDQWVDSLGRQSPPLAPAPDEASNEWGRPARSLLGPTSQPDAMPE